MARMFVFGSLPPPMNLPWQMPVYHLLLSASSCGGGSGRGAESSWILPLSLTLSAHTLAGEIKRIPSLSVGKCTGERGPNGEFLRSLRGTLFGLTTI
jgi:hypothetical protein